MENAGGQVQAFVPNFAVYVLLAAVVSLCYGHTFNYPLHFDDTLYVLFDSSQNWSENLIEKIRFMPNRSLVFLSFGVNSLTKNFIFSMHVTNTIIHFFSSILVFHIAYILLNTNDASKRYPLICAAVVSGLFAAHPAQTQAVTYLWQRSASLAALFCLLSIYLYIKHLTQEHKKKIYYLGSISTAILAMFCKESAAILPALIFLVEFVAFGKSPTLEVICKRYIPFLCVAAIVPVMIVSITNHHVSDLTAENFPMTWDLYFASQLRVIFTYWRLFFVPINQNLDYDLPKYDLFTIESGLLAIAHLALFSIAISARKRSPLVSFGVLIFYTAQAIESSVVPLADVINEHRMYLPIAGLCIALASVVSQCLSKSPLIVGIAMFAVLITLGGLSFERNKVWSSNISLWEDVKLKAPNKVRAIENLAIAYFKSGQILRSESTVKKLLLKFPEKTRVVFRLAEFSIMSGNETNALMFLNTVADNSSAKDQYLFYMGRLNTLKNEHEIAADFYTSSIKAKLDQTDSYVGLIRANITLKKIDAAKDILSDARNYIRDLDLIQLLEAEIAFAGGDHASAKEKYISIVNRNRDDALSWLSYAETLLSIGEYQMSLEFSRKAIERGQLDGYLTAILTLHKTKNRTELDRMFTQALRDQNAGFSVFVKLADALSNLEQWEFAHRAFSKMLELSVNRTLAPGELGNIYYNIAITAYNIKNYETALANAKMASTYGYSVPEKFLVEIRKRM
jgi:tetratricopeptide (TPR) repeat protein